MTRYLVALGFVLSCSAIHGGCSDNKKNPPWPDGLVGHEAGADGISYMDFVPSDVGFAPDLVVDKDGPVIAMLNPKQGDVVKGTVLKVQAKITDPLVVDDQKVQVTLKGGSTAKMSLSSTADVYEALLDISGVMSNAMLWVEAWNLKGKKSAAVVIFSRDPGPSIVISSPSEGSRHRASISLQVIVNDAKFDIKSFEARIGTVTLDFLQKSTPPGKPEGDTKSQLWTGTVKFDDDRFKPALTGTQVITATATNSNDATTSANRSFIVDNDGPAIVPVSHQPGKLIGNIIHIQATISDPAGVLPSSVLCVIGNKLDTRKVALSLAAGSTDQYEANFDTRTLTQYDLWPVMSFRAADMLGNESHTDIQVALDNGAPIIELDPPVSYHYATRKDGQILCSLPFDPLGCDAVDDLRAVPQLLKLRARIEDQGNYVPSAQWIPVSTVNAASAKMFLLGPPNGASSAPAKPLFVDTDGDQFCDSLNPEVDPLSSNPQPDAAVAVGLIPVPAGGSAFMGSTGFKTCTVPGDCPTGQTCITSSAGTKVCLPYGCDGTGEDTKPPQALCAETLYCDCAYKTAGACPPDNCAQRLSVAIKTDYGDPALYTIAPVTADKWQCVGLPFDFRANNFNKGWVCAGVVASDTLGNRGISPPIRLWYDQDLKAHGSTTVYAKEPQPLPDGIPAAPNCTGTLVGGTVTNTPCQFRDAYTPFPQRFYPNSVLIVQ